MPTFTSNMGVIEHVFAPLTGKSILDIGCGGGRLLSALQRRGVNPFGVDPSAEMLAKSAERAPDAMTKQAGAEDLPFGAGEFDGAVILNSLHHIPQPVIQSALHEGLRVIKPGAPFLIIEPLARGGYQQVFSPVDDETEIRAMALRELAAFIAASGANVSLRTEYETQVPEESAAAMLEYGLAVDPARAAKIEEMREEVTRRFTEHAKPSKRGGYTLDQPMVAVALSA